MGLMHTGSGIFAQGDALATAWEPALAHDPALLIATVPILAKPAPQLAGGVRAAWGTATLTLRQKKKAKKSLGTSSPPHFSAPSHSTQPPATCSTWCP